jgi:hypothetical protein
MYEISLSHNGAIFGIIAYAGLAWLGLVSTHPNFTFGKGRTIEMQ